MTSARWRTFRRSPERLGCAFRTGSNRQLDGLNPPKLANKCEILREPACTGFARDIEYVIDFIEVSVQSIMGAMDKLLILFMN
jgi:hypothetical protein